MTTSTKELIEYTELLGNYYDNATLKAAAKRLRELDALANEYDRIICNMNAGSNFYEFMVLARESEGTPNE